ncbi:MAG: hypothetical protein LQ342_005723 [Letrouitia transgressa]|nr:MAG: hypothetical protein LQ342_005723 [Letrouitia transgressa]
MARLQNHYATSPYDALVPLFNIETGLDIPNFPADSNAINRLDATQIRSILQELGQRVPDNQGGGAALLKRQLRVQIGLRAESALGA